MPEVPSDWHRDFFGGLWLDVQVASFDDDQTRELADAVQELLQCLPGERILDVPGGDGRVGIQLAARGFHPTVVDGNGELLARGRAKAHDRDLDVEWLEQDMWRLDLPRARFDGAICLWSSIGYGSEEQDRAFFSAVAAATKEDAVLVVETHVAETLLPAFEPRGWRWAGDVVVAEERRFDPATSRIETDWVFAAGDRRETGRSSIRIYTYRELVNLLQVSGFCDFAAYGSPDLEPFEVGSSRLLLAARRVGGDEAIGG